MMQKVYHNNVSKIPGRIALLHVFCWSSYIAYELRLLAYVTGQLEPAYIYILFYSINIGYFYCFSTLLTLTLDRPDKMYLKGFLKLLLLILIYVSVKFVANYLTDVHSTDFVSYTRDLPKTVSTIFFRAGHFTLLAIFYWASGHIAYYRRQAIEAEKSELVARAEKSELEYNFALARNAFLQQQINPHLMFNALNFVYSRVLETSPDAGRCILLLSDILRFSLDSADEDGKTTLEEEISQLENLFELNRYRFDGALFIDIDLEGDFSGHRIIPLVILTLMENIFKHGNLSAEEQPAKVHITITPEGLLRFHSQNLKKYQTCHQPKKKSGMENIRVRLEHAYPGSYLLTVQEQVNVFEVDLILNL